jgi:uncharacterized Zn finger protein (UPF0148 family)
MFDDVIRELKCLERGVRVGIKMPIDDEGYFDRKCPHEECQQEFKVLMEDWKEKVSDEKVYCPICGYSENSKKWNTPEQERCICDQARNYVKDRLNNAFASSVRKFNQTHLQTGWITMKMSYKPSHPQIIVPYEIADLMQQKFCCERCGCHYSSIGASFFCPACGYNSVENDFQHTMESVKKILNSTDIIHMTLAQHQDKDMAKDTVRQIIETSLVKLTGTFQRFMETLFGKVSAANQVKQRWNVFQNLDESSDLWKQVGCKGYDEIIDSQEWFNLRCLFQQRHLIAHRDGIIDQRYIDKTGDNTYKIGQRVTISPESVLLLANTIKKLVCFKQDEIKQKKEQRSC